MWHLNLVYKYIFIYVEVLSLRFNIYNFFMAKRRKLYKERWARERCSPTFVVPPITVGPWQVFIQGYCQGKHKLKLF